MPAFILRVSQSKFRVRRSNPRLALTLIEIMVALVMTLIVLLAMMRAFQYANTEIAKGRALVEIASQLRAAQNNLRQDLAGVTVGMRPNGLTSNNSGYFEYIEGPTTDATAADNSPANAIFGDVDDVLVFTSRSDSRPFKGNRIDIIATPNASVATVEESNVAEIIWWTTYRDLNGNNRLDYDEPSKLRRRVLLIRPDLPPIKEVNAANVARFSLVNDISIRWEDRDPDIPGRDTIVANSLEDLDKRENRLGRFNAIAFPFLLSEATLNNLALESVNPNLPPQLRTFSDIDVQLTNVCAFDVSVWSSNAPVYVSPGGIALEPKDIGYEFSDMVGLPDSQVSRGSYVDLGCFSGETPPPNYIWPFFTYQPTRPYFTASWSNRLSNSGVAEPAFLFDSFSRFYQMNGVDDDGNGQIDDLDGRETIPPYPYQVMSIEVTLGIHERSTKQVRRTSIVTKFEAGN
jgi:type II secretory pathway pseudopilin PulG